MPAHRKTTFDLGSLGWKAFQDLCRTVLTEHLGQTVRVFSQGPDRGRDAAFTGTWKQQASEDLAGSFAVQCKFIGGGGRFALSMMRDELPKIERLHESGLADVYVVMTNGRVSAGTDGRISEAVKAHGPKHVLVIGGELLDRYLRESKRLRMLVPRVYGLGDLSEVLDERAYVQTQMVLATMSESLARFVITDPYRRSIDALNQHGFVLLLGEPMAGKSMIAAALAVASADLWNCEVVKADAPTVFRDHWNPHHPGQFFWIDDAFGTTQYILQMTDDWNRILPQLQAAVTDGTRVVMTSRDYIWNSARLDLKLRQFPPLEDAHVIVDVRQLALDDRRQILYNHLKYGGQPPAFRRAVKRFLDTACRVEPFLPEVARRFGDQRFTETVRTDQASVVRFFQRPLEYLSEVLQNLSINDQAALALIYMAHGMLNSPLRPTEMQDGGIRMLGAEPRQMRTSLKSMEGSLVQLVQSANGDAVAQAYWTFRHPTISDAVAQRVSDDPELLHVFLLGSPLPELLSEASAGEMGIRGALVLPQEHWALIIERLLEEGIPSSDLIAFLGRRSSTEFLVLVNETQPDLLARHLRNPPAGALLAGRLSRLRLLPDDRRRLYVERLTDLAVKGSPSYLTGAAADQLFTESELSEAMLMVRSELVPALDDLVDELEEDWDEETDPDSHLQGMEDELDALEKAFEADLEAQRLIGAARDRLEGVRSSLEGRMGPEPDWDDLPYEGSGGGTSESGSGIFADVDE